MYANSKINFLDFIDEIDDVDECNRCLITKEKLLDDHVVLKCGHVFNYNPLFLDIFNQKIKLNPKRIGYFCCPYCRVENKGILPEYTGCQDFIKIYNVNSQDANYNVTQIGGKLYYITIKSDSQCEYIKKGNKQCDKSITKVCQIDGKHYCSMHTNSMLVKFFGTNSLGPVIISKKKMESKCTAIIKSGKNKGNVCGCKIKHNREFCKRHDKEII